MPIRLILADDHPVVLDGLDQRFRLEEGFEVVARCSNGAAALEEARRLRPDVLILDANMPEVGGLEVLETIHREELPVRVVMLTASLDEEGMVKALRLGVGGLVLKETHTDDLIDAVRQVHGGRRWFDQRMAGQALGHMLDEEQEASPAERLTEREREIACLVADGLRNRDIAERLSISVGTVKTHLHNVYEKLAVGGRVDLAMYVRQHRLGQA